MEQTAVVWRAKHGWTISTTPTKMAYGPIPRYRDAVIQARNWLSVRGGGKLLVVNISGRITEDTHVSARPLDSVKKGLPRWVT